MKIISLNTWGGKAGKENLNSFIKKHTDVDIFCFQEVWEGGEEMMGRVAAGRLMTDINHSMLSDFKTLLPEYSVHFRPHFRDWFGIAMFVKKSFQVQQDGEIFVYKERGYADEKEWANHARNLQYVTIKTPKGLLTICNFHGLWTNTKEDTEGRLLQSDKIVEFLKDIKHPHILCGDFNLLPHTKSLKKFEELGMHNLIKEFNITSTRSRYYDKPAKFADYTFTSPEIKINEFKILPDEVSDHLAMYLDFE